MAVQTLLTLAATAALAGSAAGEKIVLQNEHLAASFEQTAAGPRLTEVRQGQTGAAYEFQDSQEVSLFVVPAEAIHDPKLQVEFASPGDLAFDGIDVNKDRTRARIRFRHDLVQVDVEYELDPHGPVLRKTIACTAKGKSAYVAGVRQWMLKPVGLSPAWPKSGTFGQPAVLLADRGGCLLTLEWPRAEVEYADGEVCLSYRPGYRVEPGSTQQVAAGSIVLFEHTFEKNPLDAARHAFFAHVADRVKPTVPCPIKFTTWGPWLGQARADRVLETIDDMAYVGTSLFHFDAGWQWPDRPYSERLPRLREADDETWDKGMTQPERLPDGLLPIVQAAKKRGMALSLWFDACGNVFVREGEQWAARDEKGQPIQRGTWEHRWPKAPVQSLTSEYGSRLREFVLAALDRYDLGGLMFDNNHYQVDHAADHECLANGWDSEDAQLRRIMEIFDECNRRRPGIYRFLCHAASWPWALLHVTHIHAGDPGTSDAMRKAVETDYPARAMAYERRGAWKRHYDNFVPPWGVKGDIAGWSLQQMSPIPVNLEHTGQIIPAGEGWTQNMFTCFATTAVRDIRFSFRQTPAFDREILKEWLAWDRQRAQFIFNCRPLFDLSEGPNQGIVGFSHVGQGQGVVYLFNCGFDNAQGRVLLDENAGFRPADKAVPAYLVYPMKASLGKPGLSYGDELQVPIAGKDCVVIEVGLEKPKDLASYDRYEAAIASVRRSFDTLFLSPAQDVVEAVQQGRIRIEIGKSAGDRRLACQMLETLGAATGQRVNIDDCLDTPPGEAKCRLIIGTHEGLCDHNELGARFREALYNRYIDWDGKLISAPLIAKLEGDGPRTFCLIAPRPEQLARLAINLVSAILAKSRETGAGSPDPQWDSGSLAVTVPTGHAILRFRPLMRIVGAITGPGDLSLVRYEIRAAKDGEEKLLWREDIPPFYSRAGEGGWWKDRLISIADFAGQEVTLHFSARHVDDRKAEARAQGGFDRIAVLAMDRAQ